MLDWWSKYFASIETLKEVVLFLFFIMCTLVLVNVLTFEALLE